MDLARNRTRRGRAYRRWESALKSRWQASRRRIAVARQGRSFVSNGSSLRAHHPAWQDAIALLVARHDWADPLAATGLSADYIYLAVAISRRRAPARSGRHESFDKFAAWARGTIPSPGMVPREDDRDTPRGGTWWRRTMEMPEFRRQAWGHSTARKAWRDGTGFVCFAWETTRIASSRARLAFRQHSSAPSSRNRDDSSHTHKTAATSGCRPNQARLRGRIFALNPGWDHASTTIVDCRRPDPTGRPRPVGDV